MKKLSHIIAFVSLCLFPFVGNAQDIKVESVDPILEDTAMIPANSILTHKDSLELQNLEKKSKNKRDWNTWKPNVKRALWLSIVLPGAGQIYNRKYWKLPIFYGGVVGCIYAMSWNGQMYDDYSKAYMDIMDSDPNTESYNQFLHLGVTIDDNNKTQYQELFRKRKDRYRRWRDMSTFVLIGVYALSIIDAYVDASLSDFDISKDLSLHIQPTVINNSLYRNPFQSSGFGFSCSLNF